MRALLLEDDYHCNSVLNDELIRIGFEVDRFFEGEAATDAIYNRHYDFYLLDISVPNVDGLEVLRYLRESQHNTPAIIISVFQEMDYLKQAFSIGCHDYLKKPFELEELILRVRNAIRLANPQHSNEIVNLAHGFTYSLVKGELFFHKTPVELTKIESMLLHILVQNLGNVVSQETIMRYVWGNDEEIAASTLRYWIHRLMKKLKSGMIVNARGIGYRLRKLDKMA